MIEISNLKKVYDNRFEALKDVDITIEQGSLVCLLGPSGCGKSTMLNLIAGLLDPTSGDIRFDGQSVIDKHPKERHIGMVFQNYSLYPHMTVLENITFPLRVGANKKSKQEANDIAQQYLTLTDISELANKKPSALSGGQQQRVAIARALVQNPKILLLDEPLSNLDARLRLKIREEIRRLVKKIGVTTIFVTHDQEEALSISDKIALINEGIIQQYAPPQQLYTEPNNLFVAKFIGSPIINSYQMQYRAGILEGQTFQLNTDHLQCERFKSGLVDKPYTLAIRPEHFVIRDDGPIQSAVESLEMIGRSTIVNFEFNSQLSKAIIDSRLHFKPGDTISFAIDYGSVYLFDDLGKRVY